MKRGLGISLTIVLVFAGITVAWAEMGAGHKARGYRLMMMDNNGDGNVTKAEINAVKNEIFAELDENNDGVVSLVEYRKLPEIKKRKHQERRFNKADADDNGSISNEEFVMSDEQFEKMDKNGDGVLNRQDRRSGRHRR